MLIDIDEGSPESDNTGSHREATGHSRAEPVHDRFHFPAEDGIDRPTHAGVAEKGGATWKNALISRLHMGVGADDRGDPAIQPTPNGELFACGFGVHIDKNDPDFFLIL